MSTRFIATGCLIAMLASSTFAAVPAVESTGTWSGKIKDEAARKLAPQTGFIADAATWKKLWTEWRPDSKLPAIDFSQELVLVGTVPGPNLVVMQHTVDKKGNLKLSVSGTEIAGPGFGYSLMKIPRDGVKCINGHALK